MAKQHRNAGAESALRTGAPVITDTGMVGTITEVLPDFPDAAGGARVAWEGAQSTVVPRRALLVEGDRILVRTDGGAHTTATPTQEQTIAKRNELVVPVIE